MPPLPAPLSVSQHLKGTEQHASSQHHHKHHDHRLYANYAVYCLTNIVLIEKDIDTDRNKSLYSTAQRHACRNACTHHTCESIAHCQTSQLEHGCLYLPLSKVTWMLHTVYVAIGDGISCMQNQVWPFDNLNKYFLGIGGMLGIKSFTYSNIKAISAVEYPQPTCLVLTGLRVDVTGARLPCMPGTCTL